MRSRKRSQLVLAIYFQTTGFAYVLLERWNAPIDWASPEVRGPDRGTRCIKQIAALLALHTPDVLVLQDMTERGTQRAPRIRALNRQTIQLARRHGISICLFSRAQVLGYFEDCGAKTKHAIAEFVARHVPALSLYVPPPRKPWQSEDTRMGIFEAMALVWTYLRSSGDAPPF